MKNPTLFARSLSGLVCGLVCGLLSVAQAWAQCVAPTNLNYSNVTGSTATITFTPSASATSYTITYTYPGGSTAQTVMPNPTASPVQLSNLLPLTAYTVTVVSNCAGGGGHFDRGCGFLHYGHGQR